MQMYVWVDIQRDMPVSGDIQTTTMTLHIANKAGGGTLGTKIFFNVQYSTSEGEKYCHIATKAEETGRANDTQTEKTTEIDDDDEL